MEGYPYIVPKTVPVNWTLLHPGHSRSAFREHGILEFNKLGAPAVYSENMEFLQCIQESRTPAVHSRIRKLLQCL
jgi:hypothetical protein